jgi:hypothetical protein
VAEESYVKLRERYLKQNVLKVMKMKAPGTEVQKIDSKISKNPVETALKVITT